MKGVVISIFIYLILFLPLVALMRATGWWWLYGGAVFAGVLLVVTVLAAAVFERMFNKLTPMEEGPLRDRIFEIARAVDADIKDVLVSDASKRDTRPNAHVSGLGKARQVVVFDTMLERPQEEVISVVAHELGHWKLKHLRQRVPLMTGTALLSFALMKLVLEQEAVLDFAGVDRLGDPGALPLVALGFGLATTATRLVSSWFSRAHEREADLFSLAATRDPDSFVAAFRDISTENLLELTPSRWKRLNHSHPPFAERMAMGRAWGAANRV